MFQDKKDKKQKLQEPERNMMGKATEMRGDIVSQGDFRIDGILVGSIKTLGKLIIGQNAKVTGSIECTHADIAGFYVGKMKCKGILSIKSTATIDGEIHVEKLAIEPGAMFNAICHMKGVKSINEDADKQKVQKEIS